MTIAHVQSTGNQAAQAASVAQAYVSGVTSGNLLIIVGVRFNGTGSDPFAVGDATQTAGTATLGTIALHLQAETILGGNTHNVAIWSVPVTGTGSCTMQVGGGGDGDYPVIGISEFSASNGWDATAGNRLEDTANATNSTGAPSSGDATSAGGALFIGALAVETPSDITITPDAAFSQIYESENADTYETASAIYRIVTGGTTDAASWDAPTTLPWSAIAVVLKEQAGSGISITPDAGTLTLTGYAVTGTKTNSPVLSAPTVVSHTGTAATPKVTVTFS